MPRNVSAAADLPLEIHSWETAEILAAEVNGAIQYPFDVVAAMLTNPAAWCEFIPLVFNIKSCTHVERENGILLNFYIGRKFYDTPDESLRLDYRFQVRDQENDRLRIELFDPEGPHGTRDYRIELEARPIADGRTWIRLFSSFRPSLRTKLATALYLSTVGQDKVGFSIVGYDAEGEPIYVGGTKGIVERNAVRYYLALKVFLDTLHLPDEQRFEARLQAWFRLTEKYRRQLHEMEKHEYLEGKRAERKNQLQLQRRLTERGGRA